jgi:dTDP-4-dehydrorhamnose reductase
VKWLVTGSGGMLGADLAEFLRSAGETVTAADRHTLDVTDAEAVGATVPGHDIVVNCAAWTAVDDAEAHEEQARSVNEHGPRLLARAAAAHGARLVQLSTDYVFDGSARTPYDESARTEPMSAYGRTKEAGERAVRGELPDRHLILRTAWLYGVHGDCFPKTIARLARERGEVRVVDDQVGQPTWTLDLAVLLLRLVEQEAPAGTYHATSSGECSRFEFARAVVTAAGLDASVVQATSSADVARPAPRPAYSVLGHQALSSLGISPIGGWEERWTVAAPAILGHP